MIHATFQNHRPSGSGEDFIKYFAIYSHGGHLGNATCIIYTNIRSFFLKMLHMKFGFDLPSSFKEKDLRNCKRRTTTDAGVLGIP